MALGGLKIKDDIFCYGTSESKSYSSPLPCVKVLVICKLGRMVSTTDTLPYTYNCKLLAEMEKNDMFKTDMLKSAYTT